MYKHIIFDIDGTLIDTEKTGVLSLQMTVRELLDKEMTYDELYPYFGIPSFKAAAMMEYDDKEKFAQVWEEHFQELMYLVKPFDGVPEMLAQLKREGKVMGIVTSRNRFEFQYDLNLKKWASIFDHIICSEDSVRHKPDPDPMLAYIAKSRAEAQECLYVGDTIYDFQCGDGAGVDFALADWHRRGVQGISAKYHVCSAEEILQIC